MNITDYSFYIRHLSKEEDGGGYCIEFPELPGCMSDGNTVEEAIKNGFDAAKCWIEAAKKANRIIPRPIEMPSGKWVQRVPKSTHARLAQLAKREGVSLNALVSSFIAEGLSQGARNEPVINEKSKKTKQRKIA